MPGVFKVNKVRLLSFFMIVSTIACIARPLNILFIVGHFPAPSQTFILNQIISLIDRGHNVSIFSFHKDIVENVDPIIEKYHLLDRVMYIDFPDQLPECDIVFCQFGYHGKKVFEMPEIAAWLKDKKIVTCLRGSDITTRFMKKPHKYAQLFQKGDLFLPVCDYFKNLLITCGCDTKKIMVHYSAIDCTKFFFKRRSLPKKGPIRLISVCRLVEKKGIKYAINAIAKVMRNYPNVEYYIVGEGPERSSLTKLIKKLKMEDKIILCGWKSQDEVVALLDKAHIFLLPSVTANDGNEEGIPNALKEAMAMGLPVLATWHAGNSELIENKVSGFLVRQRDAAALYSKIMYLIKNPQIWPNVAITARKTVENRFETKKVVIKLEKIFYELLGQ